MSAPLSNLLLAVAHPLEGELLIRRGLPVTVLGVGKVAAAATLSTHLAASKPDYVVLFGVAGAYPARHRSVAGVESIGAIRVVAESVLADEGVETEQGFSSLDEMQLGSVGPFVCAPEATARLAQRLGQPAVRSATVSVCSGSERLSALRAKKFDAELETMESAAVVSVARAFDVPVVELRCVSNWTGDRDRGEFELAESSARMQAQLLRWIESGELAESLR
ncbi:MAG: futalosine hydrolase [Planctomycetota bacterium]